KAWMSALGLGILNSRSLASLPWQVGQPNFSNFFGSNFWKVIFILGWTTAFMNFIFWSLVRSFQATSGGPTTLAAPASGAACAAALSRKRTGAARAPRVRMMGIHDPFPAPRNNSLPERAYGQVPITLTCPASPSG